MPAAERCCLDPNRSQLSARGFPLEWTVQCGGYRSDVCGTLSDRRVSVVQSTVSQVLYRRGKKVKCTLVQALRLCTGRTAYRGSRGIALPFHDDGRSLPPGKARYPLYRRLVGPQGRSGQVRKISPPPGIRFPDRPALSQSLYRLPNKEEVLQILTNFADVLPRTKIFLIVDRLGSNYVDI